MDGKDGEITIQVGGGAKNWWTTTKNMKMKALRGMEIKKRITSKMEAREKRKDEGMDWFHTEPVRTKVSDDQLIHTGFLMIS